MIKRIINPQKRLASYTLQCDRGLRSGTGRRGGFTLVELLIVVSIAGVLAALSFPAVQGLQKSGGFTQSVYGLSDALNLARAYAMAQNTYVYVGLTEVDGTQNSMTSPQANGVGRVALTMLATRDGTSDYTSSTAWTSNYNGGSGFTQVRPVQVFNFFHIASTAFPTTTTGGMARSANIATTPLVLPASTAPVTSLAMPLGAGLGTGKYNYTGTNSVVICFNPQGGVLFNGTAAQWLELDVQPMSGTSVPAAPTNVNQGNQAALVIDGVTGAVTVYRP